MGQQDENYPSQVRIEGRNGRKHIFFCIFTNKECMPYNKKVLKVVVVYLLMGKYEMKEKSLLDIGLEYFKSQVGNQMLLKRHISKIFC